MADVTIQQLSRGTPTGNNILPYSTSSSTLGVPVSSLLTNAGNIQIGTNLGNTLQYLDVTNLNSGDSAGSILRLITRDATTGTTNIPVDIVKYKTGGFSISNGEPSAAGFISFNVGASERMRINSSGIVTKPFQPYLEAYVGTTVGTSNYNHDFSTSYVTPLVKYNAVIRQQGSNYNTDTGLFTAPAAGVYMVHAGVAIVVNSNLVDGYTGNICTELWGVINGGRNITLTDGPLQPYISAVRHGCAPFYLNAGDTFGIKAFGVSSSGYSIQVNSVHSVLRIAFLG